jgi:hypothetical protein
VGLSVTGGLGAAQARTTASPAGQTPDSVSSPTAPSPLLLINGMRLTEVQASQGQQAMAEVPSLMRSHAALARVPMLTLRLAGRAYDVPADAVPFLGHGLDLGLFDLARLRLMERAGRLPVTVSFHGRAAPVLPGVTVTRTAAGHADGYLTASSALRFGAALYRQFRADHDRGSYGTDGMFGRGASIALAGSPARRQVSPRFPMHTLTIHGTNAAGRPSTGDSVFVVNADDSERFAAQVIFFHGIAKVSVPAGHYWAFGDFANKDFTQIRATILPQFTVSARSPGTQVSISARSATSRVSVRTEKPANLSLILFDVVRTSGSGRGDFIGTEEVAFRGRRLWVSPTRVKPTVGSLQTFTHAQLFSPPGAGVPYAYNLDFAGPAGRVAAQQHYIAHQARLATVTDRFFQDVPSRGVWATAGGSKEDFADLSLIPRRLPAPGVLIQYLTADPAIVWSTSFWEFLDQTAGFAGGQDNALRSFRPGQKVTENWDKVPLHPEPNVSLAGFRPAGLRAIFPSAARTGDVLTFQDFAFGDNTLGHLGRGFGDIPGETGRMEVDQNGVKLASAGTKTELPPVRLSARPSVIKFTLRAARAGKHYILSPSSSTTWTWRSRRAPGATVPAAWACRTGPSLTTGLTRRCAVQPMITVRYNVKGLSMAGSAPAGGQVIGLTVGHLQLAPQPPISTAHLRVSFDGGATWRAARMDQAGPGRFRALFTAPAGSFVTLRFTATDRAGGSINETIDRAYKIAS